MMKDYCQKAMRVLQLAGMSESTQRHYIRSVGMLVDFYRKTPDLVSEQELQDYFLHRKNVDRWAPATMRICYSGIKFFFINVLQRDWHTFDLIRAEREQRLPTVLNLNEVWSIINSVNTPQNKSYLTTVYTCGLRLHEALFLEAGVNIRRIQQYLGHSSLNSTMLYLHLTTQGQERACDIINDLMKGDHHDDNK